MNQTFSQQLEDLQQQVNSYFKLAQKQGTTPSAELVQLRAALHQRATAATLQNLRHPILAPLANAYNTALVAWRDTHSPTLRTLASAAPSAFDPQRFVVLENALIAVRQAADNYMQAFLANRATLSASDLNGYQTFYNGVQTRYNDPNTGWNALLTSVRGLKWVKEFQLYQDRHETFKRTWANRIAPNVRAQLTDAQDVQTARDIVQNYSELFRLTTSAPANTRDIDVAHYRTTFTNNVWQNRLQQVIAMERRASRRQGATLSDGNPAVDPAGNRPTYQSPAEKAKLFKGAFFDFGAIHPNDVKQGDLDNCFVLAPLAAMAKARPDALQDLITPLPNGSFEVTLHLRTDPNSAQRQPQRIVVKNEFAQTRTGDPAYAKGGDGGELWVQVMEKAYAQAMGGYEFLNGGDEREFLEALTGQTAQGGPLDAAQAATIQSTLLQGLKNKAMITVASPSTPATINGTTIVPSHVYVLLRANNRGVKLYNPQGKDHLKLSWSDLYTYFVEYDLVP